MLKAIQQIITFSLVLCSSSSQILAFSPSNVLKNEVGFRDERCPMINPKVAKLLPNEMDCNSYYICESGLAILRECPDDLHFNAKKLVCDFPDRAGCEIVESYKKMRSTIGVPHPDCPAKNPKNPVLLPKPSECGNFYICDGGMAYEKTCQPGLHFNTKLKVCDFPRNVDCDESDSLTTEDDDGNNSDCPKENSNVPVYLPHPTDCEKFFVCDKGQAHLKECKTGLHFNKKLKVCDFPEGAQCSNAKGKSGKEGDKTGFPSPYCPTVNGKFPIFFRHPTNCSIYYMCGNGLAYEFSCPSGLHFSVKKNVCDNPLRAKCLVPE